MSIGQGLISWVWEDLTYERKATSKIQTTAFRGLLVTSQVRTLEVPVWRTWCSVGRTFPGLGTTPPSPSPTFQPYLKRSVRKDFSFPDHWQMFAQIYFGGISSTLLSFLCKELEEYFKTTSILPLSLSLYPSALPIFFPCPSFCPPFLLDVLEFCVNFLCHVMERLLWPRACSSVLLTLDSLSIHLPCKPEQLQQIQKLPSTNSM